jgi:NAD(P)-dependent dehydrogenase (short-subunit alcohol dehydrogenase family)
MTPENGPVEDLTAVVTGASSGIGLAAAEKLARLGWRVVLLGRDPGKLADALTRVRAAGGATAVAHQVDFGSLDEVRRVAGILRSGYPTIHVLANNAGGNVGARRSTVDGFEETIQSNHLAHFLLSHELRENLRGGRIINTSSAVHTQGRLDPDDLNSERQPFRSLSIYANAKQANILFTVEANRRWLEIVSTAFHPGVVRTSFGREHPMYAFFYRWAPGLRTPERGARTLVWLSTVDSAAIRPGAYYVDERERRPASKATDPALAERLWEASLAAVGLSRQ